MIAKIKQRFEALLHAEIKTNLNLWHIAGLLLILLLAVDLRIESVQRTVVDIPIRADAQDYFFCAYNLKEYGVYSRTPTLPRAPARAPAPDAVRSPGYPLFLYPFVNKTPTFGMIRSILITQALISAATVLLAYLLFSTFLSPSVALIPSLLTAISPHLVTMNVYVLSETLFCFLVVLAFWLISKLSPRTNLALPLLIGIVIAAASLTRPGLQYFVVPLAILVYYQSTGSERWKRAGLIVLGFGLAYAPWIIRNIHTLGVTTDPTLMINTLENGMYPNFMYHGNPRSLGFPYRFDPHVAEISKSVPTVLKAIWQHFLHRPGRYFDWYLIGKPIALWSWSMIAGMGDVFVYPVLSTPYTYLPQFIFTHALMYRLHWPLVVLGLIGCILVWLPARIVRLSNSVLFISRAVSLHLLYWTSLLMIGAPFPRYSIPLRPFLFGMATLAVVLMVTYLQRFWRHRSTLAQ
ncbi:MAG: glycosyltransferase family 39 protein [Pseudomonadota bacterium]|nr:glycosyltransferase family 39 protein [Pseudomonadota bacterium]